MKYIIIIILAMFLISCGDSTPPVDPNWEEAPARGENPNEQDGGETITRENPD